MDELVSNELRNELKHLRQDLLENFEQTYEIEGVADALWVAIASMKTGQHVAALDALEDALQSLDDMWGHYQPVDEFEAIIKALGNVQDRLDDLLGDELLSDEEY